MSGLLFTGNIPRGVFCERSEQQHVDKLRKVNYLWII